MTLKFLGAFALLFLAACDQDASNDRIVDLGDGYNATAKTVAPDTTIEECLTLYTGEAWCPNVDGDSAYPIADSTDPFNGTAPTCLCLSAGNPGDSWDMVTTTAAIATFDCDDNDVAVSGSSVAYYVDGDGDGHGSGSATMVCGAGPSGSVANNTDCDDGDIDTSPDEGAYEESDGCYRDSDQDGYGDDTPPEGVDAGTDCDDVQTAHIEINPGMEEICNGVDDNCGGFADPFGTITVIDEVYYPSAPSSEDAERLDVVPFYSDLDGDHASGTLVGYACEGTDFDDAYAEESTDCDDANVARYFGNTEVCDSGNVDEDCDTLADDLDSSATGQSTWYLDSDHDGHSAGTIIQVACDQPEWSELVNDSDCNDSSATVYPGAIETCNGVDDDCDMSTDEGVTSTFYADADGDTYGNPSVTESTCSASVGYVSNSGDCNDAQALAYTSAMEVCDGVDNDCDAATDEGVLTTYYVDVDNDNYGLTASTTTACSEPSGYAAVGADCNDGAASVNPGATESCNSLDDDCDSVPDDGLATSVSYHDVDGDGYGDLAHPSSAYCAVPSGYAANSTDCNDANVNVNPGAAQVANNDMDDNCDGTEPAEKVCTLPTFSSTSVWYQLWLDNLDDGGVDDGNWNYPGSARGRADAEICALNVPITEGDSWKANGTFSTTATSGTFYASSWSFAAYGNGDTYVNFDYITVMGVEVAVAKTSWGGGADGLFEIDFTLPVE